MTGRSTKQNSLLAACAVFCAAAALSGCANRGGSSSPAMMSPAAAGAPTCQGAARRDLYEPVAVASGFSEGKSSISSHMASQIKTFAVLRMDAGSAVSVTLTYGFSQTPRTEHDSLRWFSFSEMRDGVQSGDVIRVLEVQTGISSIMAGDEFAVLQDRANSRRVYSRGEMLEENRFLARRVSMNVSEAECRSPPLGQYAVFPDYEDGYVTGGGFALRGAGRGLIDGARAVRAGGFFFFSDPDLRDMHAEYRFSPVKAGMVEAHAEGGYRRWESGAAEAFYGAGGARVRFVADAEIYAQMSAGQLHSSVLQGKEMRGMTAGLAWRGLWRGDDSIHLRVVRPFAVREIRSLRIATAGVMGDADRFIKAAVYYRPAESTAGASVYYRREL